MKPIKLDIIGLNSFIEKQTIDFERLTSKGLFGIFGPTGSGKSTILDAITLALYGEISRDTKNYINTNCDKVIVRYEFEILRDGNRNNYIVERCMKKSKEGRTKTDYAKVTENKVNVIGEGAIEVTNLCVDIIGLKCDDFTRSVVLPQGKFSEFLGLKGKDRRNMLERIFALEKYGNNISRKIANINRKHMDEKNVLSGELKKYENLTLESFDEKKLELKVLEENEKKLKNEKEGIEKTYINLKDKRNLTIELDSYKDREKTLAIKEEEINLNKIKVERAKGSLKIKPYIEEFQKNKEELKNIEEQFLKINKELEENENILRQREKEFEKAEEEKINVLPNLIENKEKTSRALDLHEKCEVIRKEREVLRDEYKKVKEEKNKKTDRLKEIFLEIENNENHENTLNNKIKDLEYDDDKKEILEKSLGIHREIISNSNSLKEKREKIKEKEKNIEILEAEYENCLKLSDEILKKIDEKEKKKKDLAENFPGHNKLSLTLKDEISILSEKVKSGEKLEKIIQDSEENMKKILLTKVNLEEEQKESKKKYKVKKEEVEKEEELLEELKRENLAYLIAKDLKEGEPCPVCGSTNHRGELPEVDTIELESKKYSLDKLNTALENIKESLNSVNNNLVILKNQEEDCTNTLKAYREELASIGNVKELKKNLENKNSEFTKLQIDMESFGKEKTNLEEELSKLNKEKELLLSKEATISERLKGEESAVKLLKEESEGLNNILEGLNKDIELYKRQINVENVVEKWEEVKEREKEVKALRETIRKLREKLNEDLKLKETLNKEIGELESKMSSIEEVGKEKKNTIEGYEKEILEITSGGDPKEIFQKINLEIERINKVYTESKKDIESIKNKVKELKDNSIKIGQTKINLGETCLKGEEQIKVLLEENSFQGIAQCLEEYMDKGRIESIEKDIQDYEQELNTLKDNIKRVQGKLEGRIVDEVEIKEVEEKKKNVENEYMLVVKNKVATEKYIKDMERDLEELKKLKEKEKELDHKLSLIDDIIKLFKGNKFVEFVAMNRLKYIAFEASKRLKDITGNRYALEIDGEGNFTIRDDMNGGVIRDCSTLSGGETFLTSLALALSLSSQIQLKGSAPLEFFFLDEGFGTLDSNLLDIVISSLENLHSSKRAVGIISHVEELKNRVPIKLIVTPTSAGEGGTKVNVELN